MDTTSSIQKNSNDDDDDDSGSTRFIPTREVCHIVKTNLQNLEKSLRCPVCLRCCRSATLISGCNHVYCRDCIQQTLQHAAACPTCKIKFTRRSLEAAPQVDALVLLYKKATQAFGLAPLDPDKSLVTMTQLLPSDSSSQESASSGNGNDDNNNNNSNNREWVDKVEHYHVSKTMLKFLQENDDNGSSNNKGSAASSSPVMKMKNIEQKRNKLLFQEQKAVVSGNHRSMMRAVQKRSSKGGDMAAAVPSLSQLQREALDQQAADVALLDDEDEQEEYENNNNTDEENTLLLDRKPAAVVTVARSTSSHSNGQQQPALLQKKGSLDYSSDDNDDDEFFTADEEDESSEKVESKENKKSKTIVASSSIKNQTTKDFVSSPSDHDDNDMDDEEDTMPQKEAVVAMPFVNTTRGSQNKHHHHHHHAKHPPPPHNAAAATVPPKSSTPLPMSAEQTPLMQNKTTKPMQPQPSFAANDNDMHVDHHEDDEEEEEEEEQGGITQQVSGPTPMRRPCPTPMQAAAEATTLDPNNVSTTTETLHHISRAAADEEDDNEVMDEEEEDQGGITEQVSGPATTRPRRPSLQPVSAQSQNEATTEAQVSSIASSARANYNHSPVPMPASTTLHPTVPSTNAQAPTEEEEEVSSSVATSTGQIQSTLQEATTTIAAPPKAPNAAAGRAELQNSSSSAGMDQRMAESSGNRSSIDATTEAASAATTAQDEQFPSADQLGDDDDMPIDDPSDDADGEEESQTAAPPPAFPVGSVVVVQARTWPGYNKQGGVGRVTRVQQQGNNDGSMVLYDVKYILGGREKNVDAVFVSLQSDNLGTTIKQEESSRDPQPTGGQRRASRERKTSHRLEQQQQNEIPAALLAKLKSEGFDTKPRPGQSIKVEQTAQSKENAKPSKQQSRRRKQDNAGDTKLPPRRKRSNREATKTGDDEEKPRKRRRLAKVISKVTQFVPKAQRRVQAAPPPQAALPDLSAKELCTNADKLYASRFDSAMQHSTIQVVASMLSEAEVDALHKLCKSTKKGPVRVKVLESFHPTKTTLCISPAEINSSQKDKTNLVSRFRTVKSMRAAVAGVPIVSPSWIRACEEANKVIPPTTEMFIRTFPSKADGGQADFGVALLAAAAQCNGQLYQPLRDHSVYLCGSISRGVKAHATVLLREAGATLVTHPGSAVAKIKSLSQGACGNKVVLLCGDGSSNAGISPALEREILDRPDKVLVVNMQWLFTMVSGGRPDSCVAFRPQSSKAVALWKATKSTS